MAETDMRPMTLGEVLDRTFSLYRSNFWLFAGIAALPYLIVVIFSVAYTSALATTLPPPSAQVSPLAAMRMLGSLMGELAIAGLVNVMVYAAAQAATVVAVSDLYLGRPASVHGSYSRVRGRILTVIAAILLVYVLTFVGLFFLVIPGIILLCRMAVAVPAATLEDIGPAGAISRSFRLTQGSAGGIFAVYALIILLAIVSALVFHVPIYIASGSPLKPHAFSLSLQIVDGLATWIANVIVAPIGTIAFSLIYYNQRVRKEAFDLEKLMASLEPGPAPASPSVV